MLETVSDDAEIVIGGSDHQYLIAEMEIRKAEKTNYGLFEPDALCTNTVDVFLVW
jgi:hypothetical protein